MEAVPLSYMLSSTIREQLALALEFILAEPPFNNQEALRLAKAQVRNIQLRKSYDLKSKMNFNAKDAARVCGLASQWFTTKMDVDACPVHGGYGSADQREILPHERTRIHDCWYLLKLHAESFKLFGQQHRRSVPQKLRAISIAQAYALWSMVGFICEEMDLDARKVRR